MYLHNNVGGDWNPLLNTRGCVSLRGMSKFDTSVSDSNMYIYMHIYLFIKYL